MTRIRPLEREDLSAVVAILEAGTLSPGQEDGAELEAYWRGVVATRSNDGEVLVADDGEVVGVIQLLVFRHLQHRGGLCAELESVHVREDHRSRGIGAALVSAAEDLARERGCYRVQLTSNNARHDAHRFYETHGYTATHQGFKKLLS